MIEEYRHTLPGSEVSAISEIPQNAKFLYLFAHGAGAGMEHPGMNIIANELVNQGIGVFRFNFPYMEQGRRSPGAPKKNINTIVEAVDYCAQNFSGLRLLAGGKSYGGRMTSTGASEDLIPAVEGIVFFGFPLHAPGKPSNDRAEHLYSVPQPMLFLQGSKDKLADLELLNPVIDKIKADIFVSEGADHSFNVPKSHPKSKSEVVAELVGEMVKWVSRLR